MTNGVAVWSYNEQRFIPHYDGGPKRVRIDVFDGLENYAVFPVTIMEPCGIGADMVYYEYDAKDKALTDWVIDYT